MGNFDSNDFNRNQSNLHILWLRPALFWPVVNKRVTENLADVIATLLRFFFIFFINIFAFVCLGRLVIRILSAKFQVRAISRHVMTCDPQSRQCPDKMKAKVTVPETRELWIWSMWKEKKNKTKTAVHSSYCGQRNCEIRDNFVVVVIIWDTKNTQTAAAKIQVLPSIY